MLPSETSSSLYHSIISSALASQSSESQSQQSSEAQTSSSSRALPPAAVVNKNAIQVSNRQRGNPLLGHIRHVPWQFNPSILPDYVVGEDSCALFLSIKYHLLHPRYLFTRFADLRGKFRLRILLVLVDVEDNERLMIALTKIAVMNQWTIVCAWSALEAARYLESFKIFQNQSASSIKERVEKQHIAQFTAILTTIRSVNKTDAAILGKRFGSLRNISNASIQQLAECPGIGMRKAQRIYQAFREPLCDTPLN